MVFDAEYLSDRFFPEMLETLLSHQEEKGERNHVVMMVHPGMNPRHWRLRWGGMAAILKWSAISKARFQA